jgi:hypothetical protein
MATVRELVTTWGFQVDEKPLQQLEHSFKRLSLGVAGLYGYISSGATTLFGLAAHTAEVGHEAADTAEKVGTTAEKLQELEYAAKRSHVETETLTMGLRLLSMHALKAAQGSSESMMAFDNLGISIRDGSGHLKTSDQILKDVSARFSKMPDGIIKTGMAQQLFGRAGANLIPMLNKGTEGLKNYAAQARQFGIILDAGAIRQSETFMRTLGDMKAVLEGVSRTVGLALMPIITDAVKQFTSWFMLNRRMITQNVVGFFRDMVPQIRQVADITFRLATGIISVIKFMGGLRNAIMIGAAAWAAYAVAMAFATGGLSLVAGATALAAVGGLGALAYGLYGSHGADTAGGNSYKPVGGSSKTSVQHNVFQTKIEVKGGGGNKFNNDALANGIAEQLEKLHHKTALNIKNPVER